MKIGTIAYFKKEGNFFDPHYSLYETRSIQKGQKVEVITPPDAEEIVTVKFIDGRFIGEELRTSIYDLKIEKN